MEAEMHHSLVKTSQVSERAKAYSVAFTGGLLVGSMVGLGTFSLTSDGLAAECFGAAAGVQMVFITMMIWANGRRAVD